MNVSERGSHSVEGIGAVGDAFIEEVVYDLVHHDCIHGLVFDLVHAADVALHEPHLVDDRKTESRERNEKGKCVGKHDCRSPPLPPHHNVILLQDIESSYRRCCVE